MRELERRYGGDEALLLAKQEALLALPILREGDFSNVETMYSRLTSFLMEWSTMLKDNMSEAESVAFFTLVMHRFETTYAHKFFEWVEMLGKKKTLSTLKEWLGKQLEVHRSAARFTRRQALFPPRPPRPPQEGGKRKTPGHLDRAGAYVGVEEEAGEEEPPAPGGEEEEGWGLEDLEMALLATAKKKGCPLCQAEHRLGQCPKFKDELTPAQRKEFLQKTRRCFLCFQDNHPVSKCRLNFVCRTCKRRHHTLLHGADEGAEAVMVGGAEEDEEGAGEVLEYGLVVGGKGRVSLRTIPVWVANPNTGQGKVVNALLDDGCTAAALVDEQLALELQLKGSVVEMVTEGVGGTTTRRPTLITAVIVENAARTCGRTLPAQVLPSPAGTYRPVNWNVHKGKFPELRGKSFPTPVATGNVGILLGNQCAKLLASMEEVVTEGGVVARRTPLGWTAAGPLQPQPTGNHGLEEQRVFLATEQIRRERPLTAPVTPALRCGPTDKQLVKLVQKMMEVEDPGEAEVLSLQEEFIVNSLRQSMVKKGELYQLACTWKPEGSRPVLNKQQALKRLESLEKGKLLDTKDKKEKYDAVFSDWEKRDIIKKVELGSEQVKYLIPHFPVFSNSATTPIRPVFDCKIGLNQHLLPGPNLLNDIVDVLLRFRSGLFAFSGDVKQMFLRILLREEDRPFHCFLRRVGGEIVAFQFQRHVFGNAGSPCVAVFLLKEHAKLFEGKYPEAADTLSKSTLIDDVLDSADSEEEAGQRLRQIQEILEEAGMKLAKCYASSQNILECLPVEAVAVGALDVSEKCQRQMDTTGVKALGIRYNPKRDSFFFHIQLEAPAVWTKRGVLKVFPRLFDPLGLLLPYSMRARFLFSKIARQVQEWDRPLRGMEEWEKWMGELRDLPQLEFPRACKAEVPEAAFLHVFADASAKGYAAAAYLVVKNGGKRSSRLVLAKAKVAPKKELSIPRMELLAAELAVKVRKKVATALKQTLDGVVLWSDSKTVLFWIMNERNRLQQFVHNKVTKIRQMSEAKQWRWVPTGENPADLPTRGLRMEQLVGQEMWKQGPTFLQGEERDWPAKIQVAATEEAKKEMKKEEQVFVVQEEGWDWARFGSWTKVLAVLTRIGSWMPRHRNKCEARKWAEAAAVRLAQYSLKSALGPDVAKADRKKAGLSHLEPYYDEAGLLRAKTRLQLAAQLPRDLREPILLQPHHPATKLYIRHVHEKELNHAGGMGQTLHHLLSKFWLPTARARVFEVLQKCVKCRERKARPVRPPQAPLPTFRVPKERGQGEAFHTIGIDCAGPYRVKRGRTCELYYLLLCTCCHTRAVRLEWMSSLSVDALLLALGRLEAKGVLPKEVVSDNGGNFEKINKILKAFWTRETEREVEEKCPTIKWRFNPPYASHYGGVFERMIKAAKQALYHALPAHESLSLEQLATAFARVEAVLNARPLGYVMGGEREIVPLTPNHFLRAGASTRVLPEEETTPTSMARRWNRVVEFEKACWGRFEKEILPFCRETTMRGGGGRDLREGDVVSFFLPTSNKKWPMGRVVRTHPGKDGRVRVVEVEVAGREGRKKTYRRDVGATALLLPVEEQN